MKNFETFLKENGIFKAFENEEFTNYLQEYVEDNELEDIESLIENFTDISEEELNNEQYDEVVELIENEDIEFDELVEVPVIQKNFVASVYFYQGGIEIKRSQLKQIQNGEASLTDFLTGDEDWDLVREKITADDYEYDLE